MNDRNYADSGIFCGCGTPIPGGASQCTTCLDVELATEFGGPAPTIDQLSKLYDKNLADPTTGGIEARVVGRGGYKHTGYLTVEHWRDQHGTFDKVYVRDVRKGSSRQYAPVRPEYLNGAHPTRLEIKIGSRYQPMDHPAVEGLVFSLEES